MGARRKFTAEYKRDAVAMLDAPGVTVSQIAAALGIGAKPLFPTRQPLGVVIERRGRFGMAKLFGDIEQGYVVGEEELANVCRKSSGTKFLTKR